MSRSFFSSLAATRSLSLLCVLIVFEPASAKAQSRPDVPDSVIDGALGQRLDQYLRRLAPFGFSGNVLVVQRGQIVLAKGYGLADKAKGVGFTARTVVPTGSLVKPLTMLAILQLEQEGKLRTSDSLGHFFPDAPADKRAITLDQLLHHRSGLPLDVGLFDRAPLEKTEFLGRLMAAPLRFAPGSGQEYSNAGYSLLAAIIEQVRGTDFESAIERYVLAPAGMTHTGWRDPQWATTSVAHIYDDDRDMGTMLEAAKAGDGNINWNQRGNGGWLTTAEDLYRWHVALARGGLITAAERPKHEWTAVRAGTPNGQVGMAGGNGAFETTMEYDADRDAYVYVHNNGGGPLAVPIAMTLGRIARGDSVPLPPVVVAVDRRSLETLTGTWTLASGGRLTIDTAAGALLVAAEGQDAFDALTGADPSTRSRRDAASARTDSMVRAWRAGDWRPLHVAFGAAAPLEEFTRRQSAMRARFDERLGPVTGHAVLGTRRQGQALMTRVRIDHQRGSVFESYGWARESIVLFGFDDGPPRDRFLPESATSFVAFDPRGGGAVRVEALGDGTMVVHSAGGDVRARRATSPTP